MLLLNPLLKDSLRVPLFFLKNRQIPKADIHLTAAYVVARRLRIPPQFIPLLSKHQIGATPVLNGLKG